jgi:predicted MFS family arabinose efflux permease
MKIIKSPVHDKKFGPVIGGVLFQIGGFRLPFFVMGGLEFCSFAFALFVFPQDKLPSNSDDKQRTLPMLPLLKNVRLQLTFLLLLIGIAFFYLK